jgi:hypothetical protein
MDLQMQMMVPLMAMVTVSVTSFWHSSAKRPQQHRHRLKICQPQQ